MTIVNLLTPTPGTLHLSAGDTKASFAYQAAITNASENPATFTLEIVGDPDVVFANGASSVTWTLNNLTTALAQQPIQQETFHLAGVVSGTKACAIKLTATDKSGVSTDSNSHFIYF